MARIRIEAPGSGTQTVDIGEGEAIVIGRAPDVNAAPDPGRRVLREVSVSAPSVSTTHALAWLEADRVHVRDLGSRNGTWLRVSAQAPTSAPPGVEIELRLGFPVPAAGDRPPIDAPVYSEAGEYAPAIAKAVQIWFARQGSAVRVSIARAEPSPASLSLPLPTGEHLVIDATQTVDDRFQELMAPVSRYVVAQNSIHAAEQETRRDGMVLASPATRQVHRRVVEAAMQNVRRVVLLGPSGTGKEQLARTYHRHLGRTGGALITVNCATLSRDRLVADLFGAEVGAYTGAQRAVIGAVERADGGTLFLDEVGEMPLDVQSQLLRFLDTGEYQRLGATGVSRNADVCVVAATNRDLRSMVNAGTFRLDLFFRLALEIIDVPSLRERFQDALAFLGLQQCGTCTVLDALQPAALEVLRHHTWAGNFRELINFVQRLPRTMAVGSIDAAHVRTLLAAGALNLVERPPAAEPTGSDDWLEWIRAAANAYCKDRDEQGPRTWGDMTTFVEQYLKPYALAHMAGIAGAVNAEGLETSTIADTLKADRGTVTKQIRRYLTIRRS